MYYRIHHINYYQVIIYDLVIAIGQTVRYFTIVNYESIISVHMFVHRMVITEDIPDDVVLSQTLRIHLSYWS